MTVLRGFVITITSGLVFSLLGGWVGFMIGAFAPDYYRLIFHLPPSENIRPKEFGMGLGLLQGLGAGLVIGLVIVVTVAWYNSRMANRPWSTME